VVTPSVDLRRPRTELHAYVTARGVAWGCAIPEPQFQPIDQQRRPFIRSYVVPSRKARWLNDLGRVRASARVLDPFCGTGSILIEAARLGASVFGSDISAETVGGALLNFAAGRLETDLRVADALDPSGWDLRFDAVVTDLPYGRTASLHGVAVDRLATRWPGHLPSILNDEARVVVMAPEGAVPTRTPGLKSRARLTERVHKALSREIVVFERS
jgi:tRNA (guanine10-N2)-dimethyltransferase